jgi:hypothetical protein
VAASSDVPAAELEIVLDDLDAREAGQGTPILADVGAPPPRDWSWLAHLRGHGRLPYGGVILLVLALLLGIPSSARDGGPLAVRLGDGVRLAPAGMERAIYIEPGVPWAVVSVDGHPLPHVPLYGGATALYLAPGEHWLRWRADPFDQVVCSLTHVPSSSDICPRDEVVSSGTPGALATVVNFLPSLTSLSTHRRGDLIAAIQRVLDGQNATATVQPGERYVTAAGSLPLPLQVREPVAREPLRATLRLRLVSDLDGAQTCHIDYTESCEEVGQDCRFLCTLLSDGTTSDVWQALAIVRGLWTFATLSGQTVVAAAPDGLAGAGTPVILRIQWSGGAWRVAVEYPQANQPGPHFNLPPLLGGHPACTWLLTQLDEQVFAPNAGAQSELLSWRVAPGPPGVAGCLAIGSGVGGATGSAGASSGDVYLLQRFGVILAANDAAHQRWPYLPLATAYERTLAATLAATQFPGA